MLGDAARTRRWSDVHNRRGRAGRRDDGNPPRGAAGRQPPARRAGPRSVRQFLSVQRRWKRELVRGGRKRSRVWLSRGLPTTAGSKTTRSKQLWAAWMPRAKTSACRGSCAHRRPSPSAPPETSCGCASAPEIAVRRRRASDASGCRSRLREARNRRCAFRRSCAACCWPMPGSAARKTAERLASITARLRRSLEPTRERQKELRKELGKLGIATTLIMGEAAGRAAVSGHTHSRNVHQPRRAGLCRGSCRAAAAARFGHAATGSASRAGW